MKLVYQVSAAYVRIVRNYDGTSGSPDDCHYVSRVFCRPGHRGRGYARAALERVCIDADREGARLVLNVEPDGDTGMARLIEFYQSLGFYHLTEMTFERRPDPSNKPVAYELRWFERHGSSDYVYVWHYADGRKDETSWQAYDDVPQLPIINQ